MKMLFFRLQLEQAADRRKAELIEMNEQLVESALKVPTQVHVFLDILFGAKIICNRFVCREAVFAT